MLTALSEAEASDALRSMAHVLRSMQASGRPPGVPRPDQNNVVCAEMEAMTYLIGSEADRYITRTLMPRVDDCRMLIHTIHRADRDHNPHDHPWDEAVFLVVDGGYTDERWILNHGVVRRALRPGDMNWLMASDYHRALDVLPNTLTLGVVGLRVQDWGFMVDGVKVPHQEYRRS